MLNSGPVKIDCLLNNTLIYYNISVTFQQSSTSEPLLKSLIFNNNSVIDFDNNIDVTLGGDVLTITIQNASCDTNGIYGITVITDGNAAYAEGKLTVLSNWFCTALKWNCMFNRYFFTIQIDFCITFCSKICILKMLLFVLRIDCKTI